MPRAHVSWILAIFSACWISSACAAEHPSVNVLFVLDTSSAMHEKAGAVSKADASIAMMQEIEKHLPATAKLGLMLFSGNCSAPRTDCPLACALTCANRDQIIADARTALDKGSGQGNLPSAIHSALRQMREAGGPSRVILFASGSVGTKDERIYLAELTEEIDLHSGVAIDVVDVAGAEHPERQIVLHQIADSHSGKVYQLLGGSASGHDIALQFDAMPEVRYQMIIPTVTESVSSGGHK